MCNAFSLPWLPQHALALGAFHLFPMPKTDDGEDDQGESMEDDDREEEEDEEEDGDGDISFGAHVEFVAGMEMNRSSSYFASLECQCI